MYRTLFLFVFAFFLVSCVPSPGASSAGSCDLTSTNPVTVYTRPSVASDVFGTLSTSDTVHPSAKTSDGFYGFDPGVAQAGNVGLFRLRWVLKTVDITINSGCSSVPTVIAPITGICYAMITEDTPIHSSPDTTSPVAVTMHLNDYSMIIGRNAGWYVLDLNVASPRMNSLGYLEESKLGGLNGPCESF